LDLPLDLDLDTTEETAKKLLATMELSGSIEDTLSDIEPAPESNFYA